jgi:hypothetical protein
MKKIKTYRAPLSRVFPATHPRSGQPTQFSEKIGNRLTFLLHGYIFEETKDGVLEKRHTCRGNYPLWEKQINEVVAGEAILVLYEWTDKPYRSKTHNIFVFYVSKAKWFVDDLRKDERYKDVSFVCDSGIGVQKLTVTDCFYADGNPISESLIAQNDGLSHVDFRYWFKDYDLSKPLAIIHWTDFRYY